MRKYFWESFSRVKMSIIKGNRKGHMLSFEIISIQIYECVPILFDEN